jgi:hypothetical protein
MLNDNDLPKESPFGTKDRNEIQNKYKDLKIKKMISHLN